MWTDVSGHGLPPDTRVGVHRPRQQHCVKETLCGEDFTQQFHMGTQFVINILDGNQNVIKSRSFVLFTLDMEQENPTKIQVKKLLISTSVNSDLIYNYYTTI